MISIAKNTPASGALNVAAMPAAAPQATSSLTRRSSRRNACARVEPSAEPICTIGPSRPTDPPPPMHSADASALTTATWTDAATASGDRDHHLGHTVSTRLAGEAIHQRSVKGAGDDRCEQDEERSENGTTGLATWPSPA